MDDATVQDLYKALGGQKQYYSDNEVQTFLGADPTAGEGESGAEMLEIKNQARGSLGNLILKQIEGGTRVSSITEAGGAPSSLNDKWLEERGDQKFSHIVRDRKVGGVGLWLVDKISKDGEPARTQWRVLSPKDALVRSSDPVNNEWADEGIHRYYRLEEGKKVEYARTWDAEKVQVWKKEGENWLPVGPARPHGGEGLGCPLIPFYGLIYSDGTVKGEMEMLTPALKNERQVAAQLGGLTWFNSIKQLFLLNADDDAPVVFSEGGMLTPQSYKRIAQQVRAGNGDRMIKVPQNQNADQKAEIVQVSEGNLSQVVEVLREARGSVASLASMPAALFDPSAYDPAGNDWRMFDTAIKLDQKRITPDLQSVFKMTDYIEGVTDRGPVTISWAPSNEAVLTNQGDNVAKYSAAGFSAEWIARYVLQGFTPEAIQEAIDDLNKNASVDPTGSDFSDTFEG